MDLSIDGWRDWGRAAARETARRRLIDFVAIAHRDYQAGWVHRDLCERLERFSSAAAAGLSPRLVVAMPPRHGKTRLVSQIWPIWHLARHPGHEFVAASYGQELADDNSRTAREVARSDRVLDVFPGLLPQRPGRRPSAYRSGDVDRVNHWRVGGGGSYQAVGVGGPLTGRGAHIIGIDDPLKDRAEADSPARRRLVCGWYRSTAYTRLAPGGGVIITATRWHENDLTGQVLAEMAEGGDAWEVVSYPAIAEEDEPHRRIGEALHPERYPIDNLLAIQRAIGSREWAALYQQRPAPVAGGLFRREWFGRTYGFDPRTAPFDEQAFSVDATFKGTDTADFVCMQVWGRRGAQFYLLDQVHARMSYPETRASLRALCAKWPLAGLKLIEAKANGQALIDDLATEIPGIVAYDPRVSKEARAQVAAVAFEAGNVFLPSPGHAPWIGDYVEEHAVFPAGAHDDQVDATSQMLIRWTARQQGRSFVSLVG